MNGCEPGKSVLFIDDLKKILPHRYPFLMIDRLIDIDAENGAVGIKNVTVNEGLFQGHFPQQPVFPGVLIIEAMAQSAAAYAAYTENVDVEGKVILFMGVEKAKFRRPVVPGDRLELHVGSPIAARRSGGFPVLPVSTAIRWRRPSFLRCSPIRHRRDRAAIA